MPRKGSKDFIGLVCGPLIRRIRRVLTSKNAGLLAATACALTCALAGCESGSGNTRVLVQQPAVAVAKPMVIAPVAPLEPTTPTPPPLVVPVIPPPVVPVTPIVPVPLPLAASKPNWPSNWVNSWIPLESWCQFNGLERARQLTAGLEATYQLSTSNGAMTVRMGSHTLRCGGLEYWLGFAPRLIKGFPYIHSVDARKTFQPLLSHALQLPRTNRTIVIDAGHGGKDSGAKSCINSEYEKQYTLDWARRLEKLLSSKGWNVVMTRTNDSALSLSDRVAVAERVHGDLFVSLHFNIGPGNGNLAGVETYCLAPTGMPSSLNRGFGDDTREWHPNNAFDDQNFQLAATLHRSVLAASGGTDRSVCRARFLGVLRGQNRPAVLIEGGYLSNPFEARKIGTSAYRQLLAEGVANALD
jgi:N-acetylmuramoyl-L-alanine amidase